ncbi:MAG: hypothetical protein Q4F97_07000 [Bacteroidales bacterium]|nr:hypothetical protein [Bacteroidales bacterium]
MKMADDPKKLLNVLEARVRQLMFLCDNLEEQKQDLLLKLDEKEAQLMKVIHEKEEYSTKYLNLKAAHALSGEPTDMKETKLRFNKLVREIDKCIALLNE